MFRKYGLVEECYLLRNRRLKDLEPSSHGLSGNGQIFPAPTLKPVEEHIYGSRERLQLNGRAQSSGAELLGIPLRSSPRTPFNNDGQTKPEKLLTQLPLHCFNLPASLLVVQVERKGLHPFVR